MGKVTLRVSCGESFVEVVVLPEVAEKIMQDIQKAHSGRRWNKIEGRQKMPKDFRALSPGERVRALRKSKGLTQAGLAKLAGTKQPAIVAIERSVNGRKLGIDLAVRIAAALGVDYQKLL